jgi:glucokinase
MSGTSNTTYYIGIDVGGTGIKAGLFDAGANVVFETREATQRSAGPDVVVDQVLALARRLEDEGRERFGGRASALGVATLGIVDEAAGTARYSAAIGWKDVPLRALLEDATGLPVAFGHDLRAAALAESRLGAGVGYEDFLFVALGTGIGGAVVLDGTPRAGVHGRAGEIGHVPVSVGQHACACGGIGCLETIASARGIADRYEELTGSAVSAAEVAARALAGEQAATQVWSTAVSGLSEALAAAVNLLDPGAIILGGGVTLAGAAFIEPLNVDLRKRLTLGAPPPVLTAKFGDRSALVGAAMLASSLVADVTGVGSA